MSVVSQLRVDAEDDVSHLQPFLEATSLLNPSAKVSCLPLGCVEQSIEHQKIVLEVSPL